MPQSISAGFDADHGRPKTFIAEFNCKQRPANGASAGSRPNIHEDLIRVDGKEFLALLQEAQYGQFSQ